MNDKKRYSDEELQEFKELILAKLDKANKEYDKADAIRVELEEKGIILKDTREGTIYEIK